MLTLEDTLRILGYRLALASVYISQLRPPAGGGGATGRPWCWRRAPQLGHFPAQFSVTPAGWAPQTPHGHTANEWNSNMHVTAQEEEVTTAGNPKKMKRSKLLDDLETRNMGKLAHLDAAIA